MRLWNDYMHEEYRDLDCDFVFVNLWGGRIGRPLSYSNVDRIVQRTGHKVGFRFTAHLLRHTYATLAYRDGVGLEVIGALLTHRSPSSTLIYTHPTAEDLRGVLEDYMLWVRHETDWKPATRNQRLLAVRLLLSEQAEDGLAGLPRGAVIHGSELPRVAPGLPKTVAGEVFEQWIDPANLALLQQRDRTLALVLAVCGFRVSSVVTLMRDALERGPDGHPYLRYFNLKCSREAMLPIPSVLAEQLGRHEAHLAECFPQTTWLFPSPVHRSAVRGAFHISPRSVANAIERYVRRAEIRTAGGELALDLHPHLFRHHLGTSMVNENIPLTGIQEVLDHGSIEMTARYARLHEQTIKREVTRWHERANVRGERIALPADGPLEEAAWMKERIARAKQALPNGYCGLPLVQSCPHPNACLTCESFLTDGSFRAVHEQQHGETRRLLEKARKQSNVRLVEMLERDEQSLTRILDGLDQIDADHADASGELLDLRDLAQREEEGA